MPFDGSRPRNALLDAGQESAAVERRRSALKRQVVQFVAEAVAATPRSGETVLYEGPAVGRTQAGRSILQGNEAEREACVALAFTWMASLWAARDDEEEFPAAEDGPAYDCLHVLFVTLLDRLPELSDMALGVLAATQAALPATEAQFDQNLDTVLDLIERAAIERGLPPILVEPLLALQATARRVWPKPRGFLLEQGRLGRIAGLVEEARQGRTPEPAAPKVQAALQRFVTSAAKLDLGTSRRASAKALPAGAQILAKPAEQRAAFLLPALRRLAVLCVSRGRLLQAGPYDERLNHLSALATALLRAKLPLSDGQLAEAVALTARAWSRMPCAAALGRVEGHLDDAAPSQALTAALEQLRQCLQDDVGSLDKGERALKQRLERLLYRPRVRSAPTPGNGA